MTANSRAVTATAYVGGFMWAFSSLEREPFVRRYGRARHGLPRARHSSLAAADLGHEMLAVAFVARKVFRHECVRARIESANDGIHLPRLHEHLRILNGRLPAQRVALAGQPLDDMELEAVEVAGFVQPALVGETGAVDDQRLAVPVADRIALPRFLCHPRRVVSAAVRRDDAEGVLSSEPTRIEKDDLIPGLNDLRWRTKPRHPVGPALELGV